MKLAINDNTEPSILLQVQENCKVPKNSLFVQGNDNSSLSFENYQNVDNVITKETLVEYMEERIQKRYKALLKRVDKNADGVVSKDGECTSNFFSIIFCD